MAKGTCINHPGIEAASRCKMCGKGVCAVCRVMGPTGVFCSDVCKAKHEEFVKRTQAMESTQRRGSRMKYKRWIGNLVIFLIVLLAIGFCGRLLGFNIPILGDVAGRIILMLTGG